MKQFIFFILIILFNQGYCQIDNEIFDGENDRISKLDTNWKNQNSALGLGGLNYLKNNEYQELHNPGETLFGALIWAAYNLKLSNKGIVTLGGLVNVTYGRSGTNRIPFYPIVQLRYKINHSELLVGNIQSNTKHNLQEAQINIENSLIQPLEYGLQYIFKRSWVYYDAWLNWRQNAVPLLSQQEIMSFGQSASVKLLQNKPKNIGLFIPISALVYHKGGEFLTNQKPIVNHINSSIGLKLNLDKIGSEISNITFFSSDFSPVLTHTFKSGFANQFYVKQKISSNQTISVIHYFGQEYYSPFASNLFLSENINNPLLTDRIRNFAMIRYQYKKDLIFEKLKMDLRIEPIFHLDNQKFAFSTGLYFKYIFGSVVL